MCPQVSLSHCNSMRESRAHYRLSGTVRPFFCLERGVYTNIGFRHMMSTSGYSQWSPSVRFLLKALVAEQSPRKGRGVSSMNEERFIRALLWSLFFIIASTSDERAAIPTQLMLMISTICWWEKSWKNFASDVPTLFTKSAMSSSFRDERRASYLTGSEESLKLKTIVLILTSFLAYVCLFSSASTVAFSLSGFLDTRTTLKPRSTRTQQKPSPIPSVAPVTTAQLSPSLRKYLDREIGEMNCLASQQAKTISHLRRGNERKMQNRSHQLRELSSSNRPQGIFGILVYIFIRIKAAIRGGCSQS